jgi:hypothetical protein
MSWPDALHFAGAVLMPATFLIAFTVVALCKVRLFLKFLRGCIDEGAAVLRARNELDRERIKRRKLKQRLRSKL